MLWIDYREKLGIGFNDTEKSKSLQIKILNILKVLKNKITYDNSSYFDFCIMVGFPFADLGTPFFKIIEIFSELPYAIEEFLSIYIAFVNTYVENDYNEWGKREAFANVLTKMMRETRIKYEVQKDDERNQYFVFPQGAPELDHALVSAPLAWLDDYPQARKTFIVALKQYSEGIYIRDVADNFHKSLEEFLKEFFGNPKNLANNLKEVGAFLKSSGGDSEITNILASMIACYDKLNNKVAKHNDKVDAKFLEFLMYQTGLFIRMLIVVKRAEKGDAE